MNRITTYRELLNSYPRQRKVYELKEKHSNDMKSVDRAISREVGVLFKVNWYRVILDEAHHIKNANTRSKLPAGTHWDVTDISSHIRLLRAECQVSLVPQRHATVQHSPRALPISEIPSLRLDGYPEQLRGQVYQGGEKSLWSLAV